MHRALNRLQDLQENHNQWTEDEVWALIKHHVSQNKAIAGLVGRAIQDSYKRVTRTNTRH